MLFVAVTQLMDPQPEREALSVSVSAYVRLLRENSNFRRLWLAQIVSEIGDWFYILSIYSLLLQLTGKAQSVGLAVGVEGLPPDPVWPPAPGGVRSLQRPPALWTGRLR